MDFSSLVIAIFLIPANHYLKLFSSWRDSSHVFEFECCTVTGNLDLEDPGITDPAVNQSPDPSNLSVEKTCIC